MYEKEPELQNHKPKSPLKIRRDSAGGPWGEDWDHKIQRIRDGSPFKDFESYKVRAIIVKGGDDLR